MVKAVQDCQFPIDCLQDLLLFADNFQALDYTQIWSFAFHVIVYIGQGFAVSSFEHAVNSLLKPYKPLLFSAVYFTNGNLLYIISLCIFESSSLKANDY